MAQFTADIAGALNRGLQFRQENELRPAQLALANQNVANAEQGFRAGEQNMQFNRTQDRALNQQIDQRTDDQKNQSLYNTALRIRSAPDDQLMSILDEQIKRVTELGGNASESMQGLDAVKNGDFQSVRDGAQNIIDIGIAQGELEAPPRPERQTASTANMGTFQELLARAEKSGDPKDARIAQQYGVQAGFDRSSPQELADISVDEVARKELAKQAVAISKESFDSLKGVRRSISNMENARTALEDGANTGPLISRLPSFIESSIELDNIRGRMGLDVISSVTFGALSESELKFALDTALPLKLDPESLKAWLDKRIEPQKKLADELRKAASFLGQPGNTLAGYIAKMEKENPSAVGMTDEELFN